MRFIDAIENLELDELLTLISEYIDDEGTEISIYIDPTETQVTVNYY